MTMPSLEGWNKAYDVPSQAGDYFVSDGKTKWVSFKSKLSGGWWIRNSNGEFRSDDEVLFWKEIKE